MFGYDLMGLVSLLLTIWGIVAVMQSGESNGGKLVWVLILVFLPVFGFIIWYFVGPGAKAFPLRRP